MNVADEKLLLKLVLFNSIFSAMNLVILNLMIWKVI